MIHAVLGGAFWLYVLAGLLWLAFRKEDKWPR
jgi:hypothetical protein